MLGREWHVPSKNIEKPVAVCLSGRMVASQGYLLRESKAEASGKPSGNDEREERMVSGEQRIASGRK